MERRHRYRTIVLESNLHIIEYEPSCRTLKINNTLHHLSLPYIQWYLKPHHKSGYSNLWSLHMSFRNEPLEDLSQNVALPLVPNVYPDTKAHTKPSCQVCNSYGRETFNDIFQIIKLFWNTGFHTNYPYKSLKLLPTSSLKSYGEWAKQTKEDPFVALEVEWPEETTANYIVESTQQRDYCMFGMNKSLV